MDEARSEGARAARRRALVLLAALLGALGLAELGARALWRPRPPLRLALFAEALEERHGLRFEEVFRHDPELFWSLAPGTSLPRDAQPLRGLVANEQGLREDHRIGVPKPPGELRVLFLGDSSTFGYGVLHDEAFVELTERRLAARFPELRIECVNAGVPGTTLFQGWRWLVTRGLPLEPDLVVVDFGWNESARWGGAGDLGTYEAWRAAQPPRALAWSRLAAWAWTRGAGGGEAPATTGEEAGARQRVEPGEFRRLLELCAAAAERAGAGLLVLVGPGRANVAPEDGRGAAQRTPLQAEKLAFARGRRIGPSRGPGSADDGPAHVDGIAVARALAAERPVDELFFDGVHPRAPLHAALAEALAERIGAWIAARAAAAGE